MDFAPLLAAVRSRVSAEAQQYQAATAGPDGAADRDCRAWNRFDVVPRVLRGLTGVNTGITLLGRHLETPVMVSATAGHHLSHPDGEVASGAGASRAGALYVYSNSAGVEVAEFGRQMTGAWWAQLYLMKDAARTDEYLDRAAAAGAGAVVFTVDNPGTLGEAPFRSRQADTGMAPANFPDWTWPQMSAQIDPTLRLDHIAEIGRRTGLPVVVKGILHPADATAVTDAGAAGIIVSNHGRRQLPGVLTTADALPAVVAAVDGRIPVLVDGGIRSGVDVLRALALGAAGVGLGRPILWGLAAGGADGVAEVIGTLTAELRQAMAAVSAGSPVELRPDLLQRQ